MKVNKKNLDQCQYSDNKNRNSVFIYSTFMVNKKPIISLDVRYFAVNISCYANIAVYFLNICLLRFEVFWE